MNPETLIPRRQNLIPKYKVWYHYAMPETCSKHAEYSMKNGNGINGGIKMVSEIGKSMQINAR